MADKHGESESFKLRTEIGSLASKRLEAISSKSRREEIFKVLSKRRKKWRRRHGYENTCKTQKRVNEIRYYAYSTAL